MAFTVTATQGGTGTSNGMYLLVKVLTNAAATQNGATKAVSGGSTPFLDQSITTTVTGSQVYGAITDGGGGGFTADARTTIDPSTGFVDTNLSTLGGFWATSLTGTPGATTLGSSATPAGAGNVWAAVEILPNGTLTVDGSSPARATSATLTVTTASFTPPAGSLLVAMVCTDGGTTITMSDTSGLGLTWVATKFTNGTQAGVFLAQMPAATAPPPVLPAQPGKTWQRRFRHRQTLPPAAAPATAAVAAAIPVMRPVITSRPASRARVGPSGRPGGGLAGPAPAAVTAQPPAALAAITRPAPARARVGPMANRSAGGTASAVVTPLGQPSRPHPFVFRSPAPARARTGPAGRPAAGLASSVVTPLGSRPSPAPRPVIQHLPQRRAVTGPRATGGGIASGIVTPRGTPGPAWRPQPRRPAPERALWHGNAGPAAVAAPAPQAYQHPPAQARRPAPARAVWHGHAGPANAAPVTTAAPRPPAQPRSRPPQRAVWHGNASRVITPLGTPARRPGPVITSKPRSRGQWHGNTGPAPVASAPPPRWRPLPSRRKAQRGNWRHVAGTANLAPPVFNVARSTATVTTADTSAATATDPRDGTASVTATTISAPAVADPRDGTSTVTRTTASTPGVT